MVNNIQCARDRKLVKKMLSGDQVAYSAFVDEYFPKLYRYAMSRLRDEQITEEVLQNSLAAASKYLHSYRGEATLLTWLTQICRHEISRFLAKQDTQKKINVEWQDEQALQSVIDSYAAPKSSNPDRQYAQQQLSVLIRGLLDELPDNYANALEYKYIQGKGSKDIAAALNISDEAAQSLLARARRAFKERCDESLLSLIESGTMTAPGGA